MSQVVEWDAKRGVASRIAEVWGFREVIKNFVSQDLKVKYRRSALGFVWSLLNPLLQMTVISVVFSLLFRMESHYALFVLSGVLPWSFFATSMDGCAMSIVSSESMIRRQYFPKLVFPLSFVLQNLITFVLSLTVLLITLGPLPFVGLKFTAALLILPLSFMCIVCVAIGLGAIVAVITVFFRDVQHLITVFLSAWFYLTPVIYRLEQMPHRYQYFFKLNPMFGVIEMFHRPIYDATLPTALELTSAILTAAVSLTVGLYIFWRYEDSLIFAL